MPRVGICQLTASSNLKENLDQMHGQVEQAVREKAQIVAFPEMAYFSGRREAWLEVLPRYEEILSTFRQWAKTFRVHLLPGSLREPTSDPGRYFNTLPLISPEGHCIAEYRKLFLFKAALPERSYDEASYCAAGTEIATAITPLGTFGLSICFDLRFPELFRALKKRGAQCVFLPSSFTVPTGKAHWETLIRARAIENQFFLIAPGQTGIIGEGSGTYGHSLIVNPWGEVLCDLETPGQVRVLSLELSSIDEANAKVSAWECRRETIFPIS